MARVRVKALDIWLRVKSYLNRIRIGIGLLYIILGVVIVVHISKLIHSSGDVSSPNKLDADISFNLLMFGLIMASFIPMLVYSYMVSLLKGAYDAPRRNKTELIDNVIKFRSAIDFIVNESALLITMAILVGGFVFIETSIQSNTITPRFLMGYYIWYFVVAIVWSGGQFLMTKVGKKIREEWTDWWKYTVGIYLWIVVYFIISLILLGNYLKNYSCLNSVVWLKYLIIITSLWLLLSSVLWIIPSDQYYPMLRLKESLFRERRK